MHSAKINKSKVRDLILIRLSVIHHAIFYTCSHRNEHFNFLVRIKFLNLFHIYLNKNWTFNRSEQSLLILGRTTCVNREDCTFCLHVPQTSTKTYGVVYCLHDYIVYVSLTRAQELIDDLFIPVSHEDP